MVSKQTNTIWSLGILHASILAEILTSDNWQKVDGRHDRSKHFFECNVLKSYQHVSQNTPSVCHF